MDGYTRAYCELLFQVRYDDSRGDAFQGFFANLMEKRHPGDFHRVTSWGNVGDLKNDGYLASERRLFQCYGPRESDAARTIAKMRADFDGAVLHWRDHFSHWVFVSNARDGLPAPIDRALLELGAKHADISAELWGFEPLRMRCFELADADVVSLLGPIPTPLDIADVRYSELDPILEGIAGRIAGLPDEVVPVPSGKLDANGLAAGTRMLLLAGMQGEPRVVAYFSDHYDAQMGDKVAQRFKAEYVTLRTANTPPDEIFTRLREFAGGPAILPARLEGAVLALLAYLFRSCDIFENPVHQ